MIPPPRRYAVAMLTDQSEADDVVEACMADAIGWLRPPPLDDTALRIRLFGAVYRQLIARSRLRPARDRAGQPRRALPLRGRRR